MGKLPERIFLLVAEYNVILSPDLFLDTKAGVPLMPPTQPNSPVSDLNAARDKKRQAKCPLCKKPVSSTYFPFCSLSCKDEDLGNWITGKYFIPGSDHFSEDLTDLAANDGSSDPTDIE